MMMKYTVSDTSRPFHLHIVFFFFFLIPLVRISKMSQSAKAYTKNICPNEKPRGISFCVGFSRNVLRKTSRCSDKRPNRHASPDSPKCAFRDSSLWG